MVVFDKITDYALPFAWKNKEGQVNVYTSE